MFYTNQKLIFENDMIYYTGLTGEKYEVMMDWEDELMRESANYICQNGGDILEIGFGMGISANYIQSHNIKSHTIVENHPDIIPKLIEWANDKPNVIIVVGSWYDRLDDLGVYDGIFYDTYGDEHSYHFPESINELTKSGSLLTFWNSFSEEKNIFGFDNVEYDIYDVSPPENSYFEFDKYYLPKKVF